MNLFTLLFRLPLMPLRGFIRLGEILQDQAERELHDPAAVRRQLEEAEEAQVSGEMSSEDAAHVQGQAVGRLLSSPQAASGDSQHAVTGADRDG
jgi:Gas vesicle protein G